MKDIVTNTIKHGVRREIKIKFIDFYPGFDYKNSQFYKILIKHFFVIVSEEADYVFYSVFGEKHWAVPDRCIKIFVTGENVIPDFNACDYACGFAWMDYGDRYIRRPCWLGNNSALLKKMEHKHELDKDWKISTHKKAFCSFVVSNPNGKERNYAYQQLSQYKRVNSAGHYMNNIGHPVQDKMSFESEHKFSLCFENEQFDGYTTEKIVEAFAAQTIPIYWGDPSIARTFNPDAFINIRDINSFDQAMEKIKSLDKNDDEYIRMLRAPALLPSGSTLDNELNHIENWLIHIFTPPSNKHTGEAVQTEIPTI